MLFFNDQNDHYGLSTVDQGTTQAHVHKQKTERGNFYHLQKKHFHQSSHAKYYEVNNNNK
jgi:hypothetical protein